MSSVAAQSGLPGKWSSRTRGHLPDINWTSDARPSCSGSGALRVWLDAVTLGFLINRAMLGDAILVWYEDDVV